MRFRLYYSGKKPNWGIAFSNPSKDIPIVFQNTQPTQIDVQFFESKIYTFAIRNCFWNGCYELMDTGVKGADPVEEIFVNIFGFNTTNYSLCKIKVIKCNSLLKVVKIWI